MGKLISVVIPMYFEEENVMDCYARLSEVLKGQEYELIFVNDGSTDQTLPLLEKLAEQDNRVKVISFSRNFGHQMAVSAGIEHARGALAVYDIISLFPFGDHLQDYLRRILQICID